MQIDTRVDAAWGLQGSLARELLNPVQPRPNGKTFPPSSPSFNLWPLAPDMSLNPLDLSATPGTNAEMNTLKVLSGPSSGTAAGAFGELFAAQLQSGPMAGGQADGIAPPGIAEASGQTLADQQGTDVTASLDPTAAWSSMPPAWMPQNLGLTAVPLGPQLQAITTDQQSPDTESLLAFARAQGFDDSAMGWLLRNPSSAQAPATAVSGLGDIAGQGGPLSGGVASASVADTTANLDAGLNGDTGQKSDATAAQATLPPLAGVLPLLNELATSDLNRNSLAGRAITPAPTGSEAAEALMVHLRLGGLPASWRSRETQALAQQDPLQTGKNASSPEEPWTSDLDLSQVLDAAGLDLDRATGQSPSTARLLQMQTRESLQGLPLLPLTTTAEEPAPPSEDLSGQDSVTALAGSGDSRAAKIPDSASAAAPARPASGPGHAERAESFQTQADKMGQAIGQRMLSEIEKGHWHLKMMLRPAQLGHIEVEMRLRGGELDAQFTAPQALTRELLQDGMHRLKDTLTQMGMDVANMQVKDGSARSGGGDSTPGQSQQGRAPAAPNRAAEPVVTAQTPVSRRTPSDGWDVLV